MGRIGGPALSVPSTLLSDQAASVPAAGRGALVGGNVVEVAEEGNHITLHHVEVVPGLGRVQVITLPVKLRIGVIRVLNELVGHFKAQTVKFKFNTYFVVQLASNTTVCHILSPLETCRE